MINIKGLSLAELEEFIGNCGSEKYRARQIFKWLNQRSAESIDSMTDLSKKFREELKQIALIKKITLAETKKDAADNSKKLLFILEDGNFIESVIIPENDRTTLCVSTQCGCALKCKFCATGQAVGFVRNLEAYEILDQILFSKQIIETEGKALTNIVFMGMGEPFNNYENTIKICDIVSSEFGLHFGANRITVSTAGIVPEIYKFAECPKRYELAVSLNATSDDLRSELMPINKKYGLSELLKALKYYSNKKNKNILTFEYVMLKGVNDSEKCLSELISICKKINCKVNLIKFNPTEFADFKPSDESVMNEFFDRLNFNKIRAIIRRSKGSNINAACGQLAGTKPCVIYPNAGMRFQKVPSTHLRQK
ncbi:MAG TPA: 23S rRNA (adenine(2503)-C(2))-methyltransferase RlmN [bacterium]|nr:23S rRNA (adenine(2503)-C(2))-methyltransferase RlmN [bacterium]HPN32669.1 23S rRNA (adenine(2503)-C(2))-methyltransferase RlmN [bacterium]